MPPRSAKSRSSPRIQRMPSGSRPLAGSSRISTSGSPSSACASPSRWRMPSEYWRTRLRAADLSSPTSVSSSSTRCRVDAHHLRADRERLAAAAAGVLGAGVEQHADAAARVLQVVVVVRRARSSSPASGAESPTSIRIVVVLPAPFGPRNPVTVPGSQRNETSLTTVRPPRRFVRPVASIMAQASGSAARAEHGRASIPGSTSVGGRGIDRRAYAGGHVHALADAARAACSRSQAAAARRATGSSTRRCSCSRCPSARSRWPSTEARHSDDMGVRRPRDRAGDARPALVAAAVPVRGRAARRSSPAPSRRSPPGAGLIGLFNVALRGSRRAIVISTVARDAGGHRLRGASTPTRRPRPRSTSRSRCCSRPSIVPWGLFARTQRNLLRSSHERAQRLEAEQRARVEQAREAERRRIAGEMHDVLAHRLSLLSRARGRARVPPGRAAGGDRRGRGRDPRHRARRRCSDLREVIGVLREGDGGVDAAAADARRDPGADRGVARGRDEGAARGSTPRAATP